MGRKRSANTLPPFSSPEPPFICSCLEANPERRGERQRVKECSPVLTDRSGHRECRQLQTCLIVYQRVSFGFCTFYGGQFHCLQSRKRQGPCRSFSSYSIKWRSLIKERGADPKALK